MNLIQRVAPICALAGLALVGACASSTAAEGGGGASAAMAAATPEMIAEGRTLFSGVGRCGVCHGPTGRGGSLGPNLTDTEWIWVNPAQAVRPQLAQIIRDGIPTPRRAPAPMPAMGGGNLTESQVQALAAYVESIG